MWSEWERRDKDAPFHRCALIYPTAANVRGELPQRHRGRDQQKRRRLHGPGDEGRPGNGPERLLLRVVLCGSALTGAVGVQEELVVYPFSRITHCHARNEHFHMSIKTVMKCSKFVCETAQVSD